MSFILTPQNPQCHDVQMCNGDFDVLCQRGVMLPAGIFNTPEHTYTRGDEPGVSCVVVNARDAYGVLRAWQTYRRAVKDASAAGRAWVQRLDEQLARRDVGAGALVTDDIDRRLAVYFARLRRRRWAS